nr:MAG TPA: hypothetical protein [Caudoviricetes sp.]
MSDFITKERLRKLEDDVKKAGISSDFILDGLTLNKMLKEIRFRRIKVRKNNKIMNAVRIKLAKGKSMAEQ